MSAAEGKRLREGLVVAGILDVDRHATVAAKEPVVQGPDRRALSLWEDMLEALDRELDQAFAGDGIATDDGAKLLPPPRTKHGKARGDEHGRHGR